MKDETGKPSEISKEQDTKRCIKSKPVLQKAINSLQA